MVIKSNKYQIAGTPNGGLKNEINSSDETQEVGEGDFVEFQMRLGRILRGEEKLFSQLKETNEKSTGKISIGREIKTLNLMESIETLQLIKDKERCEYQLSSPSEAKLTSSTASSRKFLSNGTLDWPLSPGGIDEFKAYEDLLDLAFEEMVNSRYKPRVETPSIFREKRKSETLERGRKRFEEWTRKEKEMNNGINGAESSERFLDELNKTYSNNRIVVENPTRKDAKHQKEELEETMSKFTQWMSSGDRRVRLGSGRCLKRFLDLETGKVVGRKITNAEKIWKKYTRNDNDEGGGDLNPSTQQSSAVSKAHRHQARVKEMIRITNPEIPVPSVEDVERVVKESRVSLRQAQVKARDLIAEV